MGKMDLNNNLLWHHLYEPQNYQRYHWLEFSADADTIYAAFTYEGSVIIGGTTYSAYGRRTLIMNYSTSGMPGEINTMQGNSSIYSYKVLADNCSDIVMGGIFVGKGYFGQDTLDTSGNKNGFIGRVKRWAHSIDIGPDTLINFNDSIRLSASQGYDTYQWSIGGTGSSVMLTGAALGAGPHKIWVSVSQNGCFSTDTVLVTVKNNIGSAGIDPQKKMMQIYPNPMADRAVIDYELAVNAFVQVKIFDFTGRELSTVANHMQPAGNYKIQFNAGNFAPGIYYCQIRVNENIETKKLIIVQR
jgi:hypothetical protein